MINRKIRLIKKFIRSPKQYWMDSKHNPKNPNVMATSKLTIQPITKNNDLELIKNLDFNFLIEKLRFKMINGFTVYSEKDSEKKQLCVLLKDKESLILGIAEVAYEEKLTLKVKHQNRTIKISSLNQLYSLLIDNDTPEIRCSSNRTKDNQFFWFRIALWKDNGNEYLTTIKNHISLKINKSDINEDIIFSNRLVDLSSILNKTHERCLDFKVDLVFTWVNAEDPEWIKLYNDNTPSYKTDANSHSRFVSRNELKFALRSWDQYGDFINNIFIVSNCQPPEWINLKHKKISWVFHEEILPDKALPTFNSHAIETSLHKIKGLSKYFIYSNDDLFLLKPLYKDDFYFSNGATRVRFESYGMVNGKVSKDSPDYLNAARNCVKLIEEKFHVTPTHLTSHTPQAMNVEVMNEIESSFPSSFENTQKNKFRTTEDISVTSFLYPHFAYITKEAVISPSNNILVKNTQNYSKKFTRMLQQKKQNEVTSDFLCINDGADSHLDTKWNNDIVRFLNDYYNVKSQYEI